MDKYSKLVLILFLIAVVLSVSALYYRYIILEDFTYETDEESFMGALEEAE